MQNILVTGANGQLGNELKVISRQYPAFNFIFTDIDELDITDIKAVSDFFKKDKINYVINCAAYTAVDKAETEKDLARKVNVIAPKNLADVSKSHKATIIHVSTDYVYDSGKYTPYNEDDKANPVSFYAKTKYEGDMEVINNAEKYIIIRTSWLYSSFGNNFVKTMLRLFKEKKELNVVFDQIGSPTYARDLASSIMDIISNINNNTCKLESGIFNYSNEGVISWYDFAKTISEISQIPCKINPIETSQYPTPAKRPPYSVMNKNKIKTTYKISIPYWRDSLKECLNLLK